jgi:hypothetical protein
MALFTMILIRVARWYIFKQKNPNLGKILEGFGLENAGILNGHVVI